MKASGVVARWRCIAGLKLSWDKRHSDTLSRILIADKVVKVSGNSTGFSEITSHSCQCNWEWVCSNSFNFSALWLISNPFSLWLFFFLTQKFNRLINTADIFTAAGQEIHLCKRPRNRLSSSNCYYLIQQKFWPTEIWLGELCEENWRQCR